MKHENAIQCLQVMKGAECINALSQEFPEHYGIENIEALELAIEVLKKNQWIPCSERLPDEEGMYLITARVYDKKEIQYAFYQKEIGLFICNGTAIAWQPLPEPYEEGE